MCDKLRATKRKMFEDVGKIFNVLKFQLNACDSFDRGAIEICETARIINVIIVGVESRQKRVSRH